MAAVKVRATHDLNFLIEVLKENGIEPPGPLNDADWLVPWAVSSRYDEDFEVLDRSEALAFAASAFEWARARVASLSAEA